MTLSYLGRIQLTLLMLLTLRSSSRSPAGQPAHDRWSVCAKLAPRRSLHGHGTASSTAARARHKRASHSPHALQPCTDMPSQASHTSHILPSIEWSVFARFLEVQEDDPSGCMLLADDAPARALAQQQTHEFVLDTSVSPAMRAPVEEMLSGLASLPSAGEGEWRRDADLENRITSSLQLSHQSNDNSGAPVLSVRAHVHPTAPTSDAIVYLHLGESYLPSAGDLVLATRGDRFLLTASFSGHPHIVTNEFTRINR